MQKNNLTWFPGLTILSCAALVLFVFAKDQYRSTDFGNAFGKKAKLAEAKMTAMKERFDVCARLCKTDAAFMQAIVFPELMRYNTLKDDIESESLKVLYVQFGKEYANFSVGPFQMKPSFAEEVETKAKQFLPDSIYIELQLPYDKKDEEAVREERVKRLIDEDWQMIYLTAFIDICDRVYAYKKFSSPAAKLQWYATVYNAGYNRTDAVLEKKITEDNFYLGQQMPGKKFRYAAIAAWYYHRSSLLQQTAVK